MLSYDIPEGKSVSVRGTCKLTPGGTITVSADTAGGCSCGPVGVFCGEGEGEASATIPADVDPTKVYPFSASGFNKSGSGHLSINGVAAIVTNEKTSSYSVQKTKVERTRLRFAIGETKVIAQGSCMKRYRLADGTEKSTAWTFTTNATEVIENHRRIDVNGSSNVDFSIKKSDEVVDAFVLINIQDLCAKITLAWYENSDGSTTPPKEVEGSYTEFYEEHTERYFGKKLAGELWQNFDAKAYLSEQCKVIQLCSIIIDPPKFEGNYIDVYIDRIDQIRYLLLSEASKDLERRKVVIKDANASSEFNQFFPVVEDQSGGPVDTFAFAEKTATIAASSGNAMVEILTELDTWNPSNWRIECDKTWLYHNYVENGGKLWLRVLAPNNTANTDRTATVKVYSTTTGELADTLTITQQATGTVEPPPPPKIIYEPQAAYIDHKAQRVYVRIISPLPIEEAHLDVSSLETTVDGDYLVINVPENTTTNTIKTGGSIVVNGIIDYSQYFTITQRPPEVEVPILDRHGKQVLLAGTRIFKILK